MKAARWPASSIQCILHDPAVRVRVPELQPRTYALVPPGLLIVVLSPELRLVLAGHAELR
jgi:hypothetical protein